MAHGLRIILLLLVVPAAAAFASIPPDSPHETITRDAAAQTDWPTAATHALVAAVHIRDYDEMSWEPDADQPAGYELNEDYRPEQHCVRFPGTDNETAFAQAGRFIRDHRDKAKAAGDVTDLHQAMGKALHALQDCYSHSDYVDLEPAEQERFTEFLLRNASAPDVRLVAADPDATTPGAPDDPYAHDHYAKDASGQNDEARQSMGNQTKFEAAKQAATRASAELIAEVWEALPARMQIALGSAKDNLSPVPLWIAVAALAACHRRNGNA